MKEGFKKYPALGFTEEEMKLRAESYRKYMDRRRSIREFSDRPIPKSLIEDLIMTASSAPSGAHKQPWTFCAISNPEIKRQIREAAEEEEKENYAGRMSDEWLEDLQPFNTDWQKPFLQTVPWIIVVFRRIYEEEGGKKHQNYYVSESVGLASGFLLSAIHHAGLVSLTHTPSPMNFLTKILGRPKNEKPFLLIPIGYPADDAEVPILERKPESQVIEYFE